MLSHPVGWAAFNLIGRPIFRWRLQQSGRPLHAESLVVPASIFHPPLYGLTEWVCRLRLNVSLHLLAPCLAQALCTSSVNWSSLFYPLSTCTKVMNKKKITCMKVPYITCSRYKGIQRITGGQMSTFINLLYPFPPLTYDYIHIFAQLEARAITQILGSIV